VRSWLLTLAASVPSDQLRLYLADFSSVEPDRELPGICIVHDDAELASILQDFQSVQAERPATVCFANRP
jgi:hypothetical protein